MTFIVLIQGFFKSVLFLFPSGPTLVFVHIIIPYSGNFRGRKLSRILWVFSVKFGCVASFGDQQPICKSFPAKIFNSWKFSLMRVFCYGILFLKHALSCFRQGAGESPCIIFDHLGVWGHGAHEGRSTCMRVGAHEDMELMRVGAHAWG